MTPDQQRLLPPPQVPFVVQGLAWLLGILATLAGMLNLIAEWDPGFATAQFLVLVIAPVIWMIQGRRRIVENAHLITADGNDHSLWLAGLIGLTSWTTCFLVGRDMLGLPPAYHDEYSYLFQAKTLLSGHFSVPSHPTFPQLFDQMHVLNEGRMASRYYPGTGVWLAPWVWLNHPHWGQWLASSIASMFVYWTGYELGRVRVALVSGLACALSPGIALFSNLLLAHQATLAGLSLFVWAFVKWERTRSPREALLAGCGLSFAMICRPATAAGVGLPFGIVFLYWLSIAGRVSSNANSRIRNLIAIGFPLVIGWSVMLAYNQDVTGSWRTSPYQLYTDIYTPRHVYGFNNVIRGEQKLGPKVIAGYDRWAVNLTPAHALTNLRDRWLSSWLWTFDLVPLLLSSVVILGMLWHCNRCWTAIGLSILSLHAIHVPYWYTGIMGWHYVFETAPLWCLLLGLASDILLRDWQSNGRRLMPGWWFFLLFLSIGGNYFPVRSLVQPSSGIPRIANAISSIRHPRKQYADFDRWVKAEVKNRPALLLIESDPDDQHIDYVVNSPGLQESLLRARFQPQFVDLESVIAAFPDRNVYICVPKRKTIVPVMLTTPTENK